MTHRHLRLVDSPAQTAPFLREESCGVFCRDLTAHRRDFLARWGRFLRVQFQGDAGVIAVSFGVTERMARDWLAGISGPRGEKVTWALSRWPASAQAWLVPAAPVLRVAA